MRPVVSLFPHSRETRDALGTLDQWAAWQRGQGLSERTIKDRRDTVLLLATHAGVDVLDLTSDHIIAFCGRPELSQSSRSSYHASIRAFFKWALRVEIVTEDPTLHTPRPRRPKGLPRPVQTAHVSVLLAAATRKRTKAMITLATYAGLRVHEVAKFRGEDLDRIGGIITVTGKGGKTAILPAHDAILALAADFPARGYWFPAYASQTDAPHIDSKQVSRAISHAMRRAGFAGKAHQLRHYYATELLDNGVDVRVVKDLMRHESLATTEIYTQVSMKRMREGIAQLPTVTPMRLAA